MRQQLRERSVAEAWKLRQTSFFSFFRFMRASLSTTFIDVAWYASLALFTKS